MNVRSFDMVSYFKSKTEGVGDMNNVALEPATGVKGQNGKRPWRWVKYSVFGLLIIVGVLLIAGVVYQAVGTALDARRFPPPGQLVDVGGYQMHIYCIGDRGEGSPTVILETLSAGTTPLWGWVQPEVAQATRVCAYDRAGWGWSDTGPAPRDARQTAAELHTLLERAGVAGPYVLVGHSLGGLYVRMYASQYPGEVVGMVLLDSSHPEQSSHFSAEELAEEENYGRLLPVFSMLNRIGVSHLYFALGGEMDFADLPPQQHDEIAAFWSSPRHWDSQIAERLVRPDTDAQVADAGDLGDLPLAVITAGTGSSPEWLALQDDLTTLSTNSVHLTVDEATHGSLVINPVHARQTSAAIVQFVEAVRTGQPLVQE
jgi:pimeloyl-ACP methyl ester carboxylesterase